MNEIIIRHALPEDLDECFAVETSGFLVAERDSYLWWLVACRLAQFNDEIFCCQRLRHV